MSLSVSESHGVRAECRGFLRPVDGRVAGESHALFGRQAEALRHRPVDADDPVLVVYDRDQVRHAVEGSFPFLLGAAHRLLHFLVRGDVDEGNDNPVNDAVGAQIGEDAQEIMPAALHR